MDDWEKEDFEPTLPSGVSASDRWEGEDEDDDVKDNWADEDEEKKGEANENTSESTAYQRPKKKPVAERIAEKNKAKQQQEAEKQQEKKELTPEEKLAEKIRLQKIQEEADLKLAKGLFGVGDGHANTGVDGMYPENKEEFDKFSEALKAKITFFESSKHYAEFVENLFNEISLTLPAESIKKIGISLNQLYHEKDRQRKEAAKSKKKKPKATIKVDRADDLGLADEANAGAYYDDDDDFI